MMVRLPIWLGFSQKATYLMKYCPCKECLSVFGRQYKRRRESYFKEASLPSLFIESSTANRQHVSCLDEVFIRSLDGHFLAVQDSSIGDLVTQSVSESVTF